MPIIVKGDGMSKVDFVFIAIGIFCYFATTMRLKEEANRAAKQAEINKKKQVYSNHMWEQKRIEMLRKQAIERKQRSKVNFAQLANTVEILSDISDQEVMRRSKVTSGKY